VELAADEILGFGYRKGLSMRVVGEVRGRPGAAVSCGRGGRRGGSLKKNGTLVSVKNSRPGPGRIFKKEQKTQIDRKFFGTCFIKKFVSIKSLCFIFYMGTCTMFVL
jgi:hypothetical protein